MEEPLLGAGEPASGKGGRGREDSAATVVLTGGWLYRCTLCGRQDRRKRNASGIITRKADAFDGLDFDDFMSPVTETHLRTQSARDHTKTAAIRWVLQLLIGAIVALVAVALILSVRQLTTIKLNSVHALIVDELNGTAPRGLAFAVLLGFNLLYALGASLPVAFIEPAAGSSGIPEVKMILNGVKVPRVTRFKTLVCKIIGNILSVSSGLPVGYEGPMIHIGAAVAAGISQGKSTTLGFDTRWSVYSDFRNDKEKRDLISSGAAAGVAAAFNAPVGGVLFLYEESSSFWSKALTWRALACATVSAYVIDAIMSGVNDGTQWGKLASPGMFSFGSFDIQSAESWSIWELPLFMLLGALGGLFGAAFNALHIKISAFRMARVNHHKWWRVVEVALITLVVTSISFLVPYFLGTCQTRPPAPTPVPGKALPPDFSESLVSFYCPQGSYNDLATLWFSPTEDAIRVLYHYTNGPPFNLIHLAVFFLCYTILMCVTAGIAVPAGLFIPTLLAGSALGRFVGRSANIIFPTGTVIDPGTYSLIGSAAMLAGTTRMTLSLAVILLECTGSYTQGLPIMVTLIAGRFVGNLFNHGLYDMQIDLRKWPLLEERVKKSIANELRVSDVMKRKPLVLREIEKVGRVWDLLAVTTHNGFPVIYSDVMLANHPRLGNLAGYIQRRHLSVLLAHRTFHKSAPWLPTESGAGAAPAPVLTPAVLVEPRPPVPLPGRRGGAFASSSGGVLIPGGGSGRGIGTGRKSAPGSGRATPQMASSPADSFGVHLRYPSVSDGITPSFREHAAAVATAGSEGPAINGGGGEGGPRGQPGIAEGTGGAGASGVRRRVAASGASAVPPSSPPRAPAPTPESPPPTPLLKRSGSVKEYLYPEEQLLDYSAFEATYPRYPDVRSIVLTDEEREMWMDLRPYCDPAPLTIHVHAPLSRGFKLFRTLGLRHLPVVNDSHDVVGIITRHDLTNEALKERLAAVQERRKAEAAGRALPVGSSGAGGGSSGVGGGKKKSKAAKTKAAPAAPVDFWGNASLPTPVPAAETSGMAGYPAAITGFTSVAPLPITGTTAAAPPSSKTTLFLPHPLATGPNSPTPALMPVLQGRPPSVRVAGVAPVSPAPAPGNPFAAPATTAAEETDALLAPLATVADAPGAIPPAAGAAPPTVTVVAPGTGPHPLPAAAAPVPPGQVPGVRYTQYDDETGFNEFDDEEGEEEGEEGGPVRRPFSASPHDSEAQEFEAPSDEDDDHHYLGVPDA